MATPTDDSQLESNLADDNSHSSTTIFTDDSGTKVALTHDPYYMPDPNDDDSPDIIYYTPKS